MQIGFHCCLAAGIDYAGSSILCFITPAVHLYICTPFAPIFRHSHRLKLKLMSSPVVKARVTELIEEQILRQTILKLSRMLTLLDLPWISHIISPTLHLSRKDTLLRCHFLNPYIWMSKDWFPSGKEYMHNFWRTSVNPSKLEFNWRLRKRRRP